MRLDKTQVPSIVKFDTPGWAGYFVKDLHVMAGYTTYEAMLVGGRGGRSGDAWGQTSGERAYSSGGGGAGSLQLAGKLSEMVSGNTLINVGAKGADGLDSGSNEAPAGHGVAGGYSRILINGVFYVAEGGLGAIGADWDITASRDFVTRAEGGNGGGNSAGLGTGGVGGKAVMTDPQGDVPEVPATNGTWVAGGAAPVVGGGRGGGGAYGRVKTVSKPNAGGAGTGAWGNNGAPYNYSGKGQSAGTNDGGHGGGAKIYGYEPDTPLEFITQYGGGGTFDGGVVVLKFDGGATAGGGSPV